MKTHTLHRLKIIIISLAIATARIAGTAAAPNQVLPYGVAFEVGDEEFAKGDSITLQRVSGTSDVIKVGETYCVEGTYTLGSQDEADIGLHATGTNSTPTRVEPGQTIHIKRGSGTFRLVKTMNDDGFLHVSFYTQSAFGGVYFGQGAGVLRHKGFSYTSESSKVALAGPNRTLLEYLGNPVPPPANLDARYTRDGLTSAVQLAAKNAGITLKKLIVDDSEYPFLVGVCCGGSDAVKLKAQIKSMDGYQYNGSVGNDVNSDGSDTCNAFSMVPYENHPREAMQSIDHRLLLRQQVFFNRLITQR